MSTAEHPSRKGDSLADRLANVLTDDIKLKYNHVSTPPTRCEPLYGAPSGRRPQRTYRESHLLAVSVHPKHDDVFVFALEVFIYSTRRQTTLFVSKADSTGCSRGDNALKVPPARQVAATFIQWLLDKRQRHGIPFTVSLFARAQNQYLFPGSESNAGKHILDDRQLVRWWCKTLDALLSSSDAMAEDQGRSFMACKRARQGYLIVPGFDAHETQSFFPHGKTELDDRWQYGHPLNEISPYPSAAPRSMVPRFPDDPKTRYVEELDDEIPNATSAQKSQSPSKRGNGVWKSVHTLSLFWDMMAFRQECRSGRLVGFIWLVVRPQVAPLHESQDSACLTVSQRPNGSASPGFVCQSTQDSCGLSTASSAASHSRTKSGRKMPLRGPIIPREPRIKTMRSASSLPEMSEYYLWPADSRGHIVLAQTDYDRLHDLLLKLDFTSDEASTDSTAKWLTEAASVTSSPPDWGTTVCGKQPPTHMHSSAAGTEERCVDCVMSYAFTDVVDSRVNDLSTTLVRKKRKVGVENSGSATSGASMPAIDTMSSANILDSSLVRKKIKT